MDFRVTFDGVSTAIVPRPAGKPACGRQYTSRVRRRAMLAGPPVEKTGDGPLDERSMLKVYRVAHIVARVEGVDVVAIEQARGFQLKRLRQVVMYLAHTAYAVPHEEIGRVMGLAAFTVRYAVRVCEERRDDAAFDGWLSKLERRVRF